MFLLFILLVVTESAYGGVRNEVNYQHEKSHSSDEDEGTVLKTVQANKYPMPKPSKTVAFKDERPIKPLTTKIEAASFTEDGLLRVNKFI